MSDAVVYEQLDEGPPSERPAMPGALASAVGGEGSADLRRLSSVPMELSVEIGRTLMTVGETLGLRPGSIVTLERLAGEPVDLLVNGTPIARGEVVVVDEQFGLRIIEILAGANPTGDLGGIHREQTSDSGHPGQVYGGQASDSGHPGETYGDQVHVEEAHAIEGDADPDHPGAAPPVAGPPATAFGQE